MSQFSDAFEELLNVQEESRGSRLKLIVSGKEVDALIEEDNNSFINLGGGQVDAGTYKAMVRISDFQEQPAQKSDVTDPLTGVTQSLLEVTRTNDVYVLTIGDMTNEDQ